MASQTNKDDAEALSSLVEEVLLQSDSDLDFADDDLAQDMATSLPSLQQPRGSSTSSVLSGSITGSITESVGGGRRVSRASLAWFQRQTAANTAGLITGDGKLSDDYILQRQSVNRPAVLKTIPRLADLSAEIDVVDGWVLTQMFLSGYAKLAKQVGESSVCTLQFLKFGLILVFVCMYDCMCFLLCETLYMCMHMIFIHASISHTYSIVLSYPCQMGPIY